MPRRHGSLGPVPFFQRDYMAQDLIRTDVRCATYSACVLGLQGETWSEREI